MKSSLAILESNLAVPLTRSASFGLRCGMSGLEIAQARQRGKARAECDDQIAYQEQINTLMHKLFAKEITHTEFKKKERRLKEIFSKVRK